MTFDFKRLTGELGNTCTSSISNDLVPIEEVENDEAEQIANELREIVNTNYASCGRYKSLIKLTNKVEWSIRKALSRN